MNDCSFSDRMCGNRKGLGRCEMSSADIGRHGVLNSEFNRRRRGEGLGSEETTRPQGTWGAYTSNNACLILNRYVILQAFKF